MVKIARNLTLLSLLFVFVSIAQVSQAKNQSREFSVLFRPSSPQNDIASKDFSEQADNGTSTASLIVSHGSVSYSTFSDYNGNGYYRRVVYWFDIDSNKKVNYYVIFYLDSYDGYGWYTSDGFKSDVYTMNGYSPEDGIYMENLFWSGYKQEKEAVKVELYYEDGTLADTYGPDDNPDLSNIKVESIEYDVKGDPFATPTPSPEPSPYPTPTEPATGDVSQLKIDPEKLIIRKGKSIKVSVEASTEGPFGDIPVPNVVVKVRVKNGKGRINISPLTALTDENGRATFTVVAKKRTGNTRVTFMAGSVKSKVTVKVIK